MSLARTWSIVCLLLSLGILAAAIRLGASGEVLAYERPAFRIAIVEAAVLAVLAVALLIGSARLGDRLQQGLDRLDQALGGHPGATLLWISFVGLFVELMLIRYCSSQVRIFSFYKNVPLIGCFLGLGLGCWLGRGRSRHALGFLLWLVPVAVALSAGSIVVRGALDEFAALGSSEHILGDVEVGGAAPGMAVFSQVAMAVFCVMTLVVITLLFEPLGRLLGSAFEELPRLRAYTLNIAGSLAGILTFIAVCYLETPPWVWFLVGLLPLLRFVEVRPWRVVACGLIGLSTLAVLPSYGETVWSRYQKLVGHPVGAAGSGGYLVQISDVFYQVAVDLRPEKLTGRNPYPHYDAIYRGMKAPERVLIVGAGTGNDVAAALRAGAKRVDAVDIDPAIVAMGRRNHPERPYSDPRVQVLVDDARHAFRTLPERSFDLVVFGLLDSHTQLGTSSVRLDNYVFTLESLTDARRLVKPGGHIALTAAVFSPWLRDRFRTMLSAVVAGDVQVEKHGLWHTFLAPVTGASDRADPSTVAARVPTDDWPFIYLPQHGIPLAYVWVVLALLVASIVVLKRRGLPFGGISPFHGHMFFLGAAFLLMEVHAINRLALLFGTVWLVSAVTIALVLLLIVAANLTVLCLGRVPYALGYGLLGVSLAVSYLVEPAAVIGAGTGAALGFGLVLLSPVYFAGLVFARSFDAAKLAGPAIGANILGSVLGGWIEYGTMALGMRSLVLLAAGFYGCSLVLLVVSRRGREEPAVVLPEAPASTPQAAGDEPDAASETVVAEPLGTGR